MTKTQHFFVVLAVLFSVIIISNTVGNFVVGQNVRLGQLVILLSILLGMIISLLLELFSKKFP
jgi:uncharacterized membrane protein YadS